MRRAILAALLLPAGALPALASTPADIIGRWSVEEACGAQSRIMVITMDTLDFMRNGQSAFKYSIQLLQQQDGTVELLVKSFLGPESARSSSQPMGDALFLKRDGNKLTAPFEIDHGEKKTNTDEMALYRCS